jgi:hypothetical protein
MGDRVAVQEGDFWGDDLGAGYDVALLFTIIHAYLPEKNVKLLVAQGVRRASTSLC